MSSTGERGDGERRLDWLVGPLDAWHTFDLVSVLEPGDEAPDRCTVYLHGTDEALATRWITAEEEAFVSVADVR